MNLQLRGTNLPNRERMILIRNHLANNVKDSEFDINIWMNDCGTIGCAIGHSASIPELRDVGFKLLFFKEAFAKWQPFFDGAHGTKAIMKLLDIDRFNANFLFLYSSYESSCNTTRQMVIDRIDQFLKDN